MDGALVTSSSSFSTAAPTQRWTYDVFLSFRGDDTRNNFVDHLYAALDQAGIYTFKDDEKLQRGKSISPELLKAIEESMVAVVVFSKNYANSCWCLDELAKIIECHDLMGQRVLPLFYDVDPSDIRGQKGSLHASFKQHEEKSKDKVRIWREALKTAANLSGWDVPRTASGHEAECIKQIVRNIWSYTESLPADNLIGMESRIQHVKSLLGTRSGDVFMIGIWGMGGIGKTTIARAVYRQISYEFEGSSFLEDVRENGSNNKGLKSLQEKLLSEILMVKDFKVKDCDDGMSQIRRRLGRKKILVVLDDVANIKQLEFLAGANEWFGPGSRIMVTTRDEHLLSGAQKKYAPELLRETEAMKLFSKYAFKTNIPPKEFEKLSGDVVSHSGYLPLALKVLGSYFCDMNLDIWQSALDSLTKIQHMDINGILKLSYDGLDELQKKIFLDIACFFKGIERLYVTRTLDSFGYGATFGIHVLIQKSLLTISNGCVQMHDLIQEMGRCIVRESYSNTMVWVPEEIKEAMTTATISETVEAIVAPLHYNFTGKDTPCCSEEVFKSMKKLRLLTVNSRFTSTEPANFPEQLKWLSWTKYPFESLRLTRSMARLVGLEVYFGCVQQLIIEKKIILSNLKFINLCASVLLTSFPDLSGVPNLEGLNLSFCKSLMEVDQSVLLHERIVHLNLSSCSSLKSLPPSIQMKSLQTLLLSDCENLERFPEVTMEMGRLSLLNIDGCDRMSVLPSSITLLTGLTIMAMDVGVFYNKVDQDLEQGYSTRINNLCVQGSKRCLRILCLEQNPLIEDDFPTNLHTECPSLEELYLSWNLITRLPATIYHISLLKRLDLRNCPNLEELDELPSLIQVLRADHCTSLKKIGDFSNKYKWLFKISLHCCPKLRMDQESQSHIDNFLMKSLVQRCAAVGHRLSVAVPGNNIPDWFSNRRTGNKIALNIPQNKITEIKGLAICCLLNSERIYIPESFNIKFQTSSEEKSIDKLIDRPARTVKSVDNVLWIGYLSIKFLGNLCYGFESKDDLILSFETDRIEMMECGVCVVYKDDMKPVTGMESWIPDYDDLVKIHQYTATSDDLQRGRWSEPTFSLDNATTGERNRVFIDF